MRYKQLGETMKKGLIHIYTGNGKGKTTAAVGLTIRAVGRGMKVLFIQCLKSTKSGEIEFMNKNDDIEVYRSKDIKGFIWDMNDEQKKHLKKTTQEAFKYFKDNLQNEKWDMIVFDEVMGAISNDLISTVELINVLINKPDKIEIVLTGRNAPKELINLADYVSEINPIKHPAENGIPARKGIEL
jgi:cob(I)alamin adenosyltransferase